MMMQFIIDDSLYPKSLPAIWTWILAEGVREGETCNGENPAWVMRRKLLQAYGPGGYVLTDGNLYYDDELVVHRDDVRSMLWDVEVSLQTQKG